MAKKLSKGTRFRLLGSNESDAVLVLACDADIEEISDQAMVGTLIDDQTNFQLNIANVPGNWNPVTGAAEPPETDEPAVIMPIAEEETEKASEGNAAPKKKAAKRSKAAKKTKKAAE